jgi:hypothetical protein
MDLRETDLSRERGLVSSGSAYKPTAGSCENDNKPLGSIKFWEFLVWLSDWRLLNKDLAPWSE